MKESHPVRDVTGASEGAQDITRILKAISADLARLVLLEARLFGHTALAMVGLTVMVALLLVGGWFFAGAALVTALASLQTFGPTGALLIVALLHLLLAGLAYWRLRHITRDLMFRQSRASANSLLLQARAAAEAAGHDAAASPPEQDTEEASGSAAL